MHCPTVGSRSVLRQYCLALRWFKSRQEVKVEPLNCPARSGPWCAMPSGGAFPHLGGGFHQIRLVVREELCDGCVPTFGDFDGLSKLPFEAARRLLRFASARDGRIQRAGAPHLVSRNATLMTEGEIPRASISPARAGQASIRARDARQSF